MRRFHFLVNAQHVTVDALEFLHRGHLRHHDLGVDFDALVGAQGSGLHDGADLHRVDLGVGDTQAHAAMAQHRVDLSQRPHLLQDFFLAADHIVFQMRILEGIQTTHQLVQTVGVLLVQLGAEQLERVGHVFETLDGVAQLVQVGDFEFELRRRRQELVHRRIEQPHRHRQPLHGLEDAFEVGSLDWQQAIERRSTFFGRLGQNHFLHDGQTIRAVEHAFGTAQADAHGAKVTRALCVFRRVGVAHHLEPRHLVSPGQQQFHLL